MFQISFLNAGLLIFAAATILPLLIWLIARRKPRRVVFSSLRFIKLSREQEKKRARLKNIILLIIRMLIILLVTMAVARPLIRSPRLKPSGKHPPTAIAILVDTSLSMDYVYDSQTFLDRAKAALRQINARCTSQDRIIPISSSAVWNAVHAQIYASSIPEDVITAIGVTYDPMPVAKMLELAGSKLSEAGLPNRETYLITDGLAANYPQKSDAKLLRIPLPKPDSYTNLSCSGAEPIPQLVERSRSQSIRFSVSNHGGADSDEVLLRVVLDDVKMAEKFVTIPARSTINETMAVDIRRDGWQSGYVEVVDDRLVHDNRSYFAFPFNVTPRIAVVTSHTSLPFYLESMLRVYAGTNGTLELISPQNVNITRAQSFPAVVIYAPGAFTPKLRDFISTLAKLDKGMLFVLESQPSQDYLRYLESLFGAKFGEQVSQASQITDVNRHHFISSMLSGKRSAQDRISGYRACTPGSSTALISAGRNAVAITRDKLLLFTFDPAITTNTFFLSPAYPVLTYRGMEHIARADAKGNYAGIGDVVSADAITLPDGSALRLANRSHRVTQPGIYKLSQQGSEPTALAVNIPSTESDMAPANFRALPYIQTLPANWTASLFSTRLGHDIWKILLMAALALFILEIILVKLEEARPGPDSKET